MSSKRKEIDVLLSNRKAQFSPRLRSKVRKDLRFHPPGFIHMPAYKRGFWDGYINLYRKRSEDMSSGLFLALRKQLEEDHRLSFNVERNRRKMKFRHADYTDPLEHQVDCVEAMIEASRCGGIVLAPTGSGKTRTAAMFFERLRGRGLFIVDELTLLYQTKKSFEHYLGEKVGIVGDSNFEPRRITVATIQTLHLHREQSRFRKWLSKEPTGAVIIDEVHLAVNKRAEDVIAVLDPIAVYGLTATLELQKKEIRLPAYALCGPVIYEYKLKDAQDNKVLSRTVVVSVQFEQYGVSKFRTYHDAYDTLITDNDDRNELVKRIVRRACKRGRKVLLLVDRVRHLKELSEALEDIPHRRAHGEKDHASRTKTIRVFAEGKISLIIANKVFQKAVDIPSVDFVVDASGAKSKNSAMQKLGRGTRRLKGKDGLIHVDITDRSPKGIRKREPGWNVFHSAASSRLKAYQNAGITVEKFKWDFAQSQATDIINLGEHILNKMRKKNKRK